MNAHPLPAGQAHLTSPKYRADIDGLRAIAIIAVITDHYYKNILPSGYLGVDIFFVISGYVITSALVNRNHLSFNEFILDFYRRRVKRLLPALLLCVVITSLIGFLFIHPSHPSFNDSWITGVTALFGFSNLYLLWQSSDYFGSSAELNLFTHTWSLGVEEQFYLIFPLLVWISGFSPQNPSGSKKLFYGVGALSVVSVVSFVYLSGKNFPASYFMMTSRFWELGAGCLVFLMLHKRILTIKLNIIQPEFFIVILVAALFIPLDYQIQATALVVLLTALLIGSLRPSSSVYRVLTLKPVVFIGLISYSLYLWHWSVLAISRWTIGMHWWSFPIQIGVTFILAFISYRYVESPLRHLDWSTKSFATIIYGLAASIGCAALLTGLGIPLKGYLYSGKNTTQIERYTSKNNGLRNLSTPLGLDESVAMKWLECNMTPQYLRGENYQSKPVVDQRFFLKCLSDSKPKVILIGDSFASVIEKHVALAAGDMGYEFKFLFGYVCPYPLDPRNITNSANRYCDVDPNLVKTGLLQNINSGDIVVLRLFFQKAEYLNYTKLSLEIGGVLTAYDREIESLYHAISARGGSLLLIGSNPNVPLNPECVSPQWFNSLQATNCREISLNSSLASNFAVRHDLHLLKQFSGKYPNLEVITPTKFLCDQNLGVCPLTFDGAFLYKDDQHISSVAVDLIYPEIISSLHHLAGQ